MLFTDICASKDDEHYFRKIVGFVKLFSPRVEYNRTCVRVSRKAILKHSSLLNSIISICKYILTLCAVTVSSGII